jgi:xanthine/CO dehydrogenase XdhC/CoxF family maturation factor
MNELERIVHEAARLEAEGSAFLLATVVRVAGSSYRRPGARMLVARDRWLAGCVSGGCLEGDVMLRGAHRARAGAVVVTYDSTAQDGEPWGAGLGCNGVVDVLLEHVESGGRNQALAFARACFAAEHVGALATVIRSKHPLAPVGTRLAVGPGSELVGAVADPVVRQAMANVVRGATGVIDLAELGITVLVERITPSPQLFVLGSAHDAAPIVVLAKSIGMRVTVADRAIRDASRFAAADRVISTSGRWDRVASLIDAALEPYVVIMHHQHDADRDALEVSLASRARYIGALGPLRRTHELLAELGRRPASDPRLHAPIGLDVGAETPEQIALAVVAEIQAVQRRRSGGMLRDCIRPLHADVAFAVLAAGASRRLGRPKQLVMAEGSPIVRRVAATCESAQAGPVAVVLGAHAGAVASALTDVRATLIINETWQDGIASSIRAAVRWAETTSAHALTIVLSDQPFLSVAHLTALRDAWWNGAPLVASRFGGVLGAPAVFDRSRWGELARLEGDQGAGLLLRALDVVAIDWADGAFDVDTEDDVLRLGHQCAASLL